MLEQFGWSDALQHQFAIHAADGLIPARVIVQQRGLYEIATELGELSATLAGKLAYDAEDGAYPVAGDWVAVKARPAEGSAVIQHLLPRTSSFVRRASGPGAARGQVVAANVDVALLAASLNADLNPRRLERYLATAWENGVDPIIVLTKADMGIDAEAIIGEIEAVAMGAPVLAVSAVTGAGLDELRAYLKPGRTAVLLGSSGVGKSTLVNALAGKAHMATQAIREDDARGRHTTTHRELVLLPWGALILDTPGMRELGLWEAGGGVSTAFADIEALAGQCRFHDCGHDTEPGCAIAAALATGALDAARWKAYGKLQRELEFQNNKDDPRAQAEGRRVRVQRNKQHRAEMKRRKRFE
ncbi:ribosome small subunit-dependent GTPase A [Devosia sp. ZB163]|uniref:ribosome small subunit-dependent GTPase A n=1 Tax=Devosia sp. ZB163 TaxID=3025938 RepID=UPI00235E6BE4|nr:ribosome small subunit-dependent GTPase A [Devosia sp. ZB163]MDC9825480.1 ribosome small subunit-dependent GTPase A [Devosia sp. ZB163]